VHPGLTEAAHSSTKVFYPVRSANATSGSWVGSATWAVPLGQGLVTTSVSPTPTSKCCWSRNTYGCRGASTLVCTTGTNKPGSISWKPSTLLLAGRRRPPRPGNLPRLCRGMQWANTMGAVGCIGPASLDHVTRGTTLVSDCGGVGGGASSRVVGLNPRPTNGTLSIGTPLYRAVCALLVTRARAVHWDGIHRLHPLSRDSCSWAGPVFEQAVVAGWRTTRYLAGQKNLHPSRAPMPDIRSHRCQISGAAIVSGHPHMSQISGWCREESGPLARPDICPHPVPRYPAVCS
jgi:hypothetical protein